MPRPARVVEREYDALDDKILAMYSLSPRPTWGAIKKKIPGASQSRIARAVWRYKRSHNGASNNVTKLHSVKTSVALANETLEDVKKMNDAPLGELRALVHRFVQDVAAIPDPIQELNVSITTPQGTVSVKMAQEVKFNEPQKD